MTDFLKNITPREYQNEIAKSCLEKNCLVVLPTGLGKTLIALIVVIERMKKYPGKKVVFLAPTRPLGEQHLNYFKKNLPELFADMQIFTGKINAEKRKKIWQTADIIFSTPQCVANDLKKNLYSLEDVCLLIEDEAHRCVKNYSYNFVAQKYLSQATNPRIIGLTASPGHEIQKIKTICKNLSVEEVELRTRKSEDVSGYLQKLEIEKIIVDFPKEMLEIRHILREIFDSYIEELRKRNVLWGANSKTGLIELQKKISATIARGNKNFNYFLAASACAQAIKLQHALELLETQTLHSFNQYLKKLFKEASERKSKGVMKLVAKSEFNYIYMVSNELLSKNFEHPKIRKLEEITLKEFQKNPKLKIIVFTQFRESARIIAETLNKQTKIKAQIFVGQTKKNGTGLDQKEQKKVIEDFSEGKINILVATSIAEEGLDIPEVNAVVFYEPIPSAIRKIQRTGRTARLAKGKLITLITKGTRDETFYYVSRSREKKMQSSIETIKEDLASGKFRTKEKQKKLI
jgi:ERCC4-related helicase